MSLSNDLFVAENSSAISRGRVQPEEEDCAHPSSRRERAAIVGLAVAAYKVGSPYLEAKYFQGEGGRHRVALVSPTQARCTQCHRKRRAAGETGARGRQVIGASPRRGSKKARGSRPATSCFEFGRRRSKSPSHPRSALRGVGRGWREHAQIREAQQHSYVTGSSWPAAPRHRHGRGSRGASQRTAAYRTRSLGRCASAKSRGHGALGRTRRLTISAPSTARW